MAIIGILSAVAVPNFKKYQAKAKTTEAKVQLAAAYTAEQAFYSDYGMYAHCLGFMGYDPMGETNARYFMVGFGTTTAIDSVPYTTAVRNGLVSTNCPEAGTVRLATVTDTPVQRNVSTTFPAGKGNGNALTDTLAKFTASLIGNTATIGNQDGNLTQIFTIGAVGIISSDNTANAQASVFSINQNKDVRTINPGY
jgi:type IV pilus assembly protein PilA